MESLKKSFMYQGAYQVLKLILPLITAPYIARVLGASNSGIYSFTHTVANYFVVLSMLGLEQYGNRTIAKVRDDASSLNKVFTELFVMHACISLVSIALYIVYCFTTSSEYRVFFLLQGFWVVSSLFDINWFFFGIGEFKITVTRNTIIKILTVVATFLFVKTDDDLGIYTFILSFSMLISQWAVWPMLRRYVKFTRIERIKLYRHLRPLLLLFVAVIAANLNRSIDKAMLGWFGRITELGYYDYADRIVRIPLSLIAAFGTVMLSKMSNLYARGDNQKSKKMLSTSACLIMILCFGMGFGIAAISPEFVILFLGAEYEDTVLLLVVLSLSIPIVGWNNYIRTQVLIPKEMDMLYTKAVTIGAVFNILSNCVLIYLFGAKGAALATVFSYAVIMLIQIMPLREELNEMVSYIAFPIVAGFVMYGAVRLASLMTENLLVSVSIELLVGVIVYSGLSFLYLSLKQPRVLKAIFHY